MDRPVGREAMAVSAGAPATGREARTRNWTVRFAIAALLAVAVLAAVAWQEGLLLRHPAPLILQLSGNIEAHESVLSFKSVQSRIIELPFDEGASVKRGTVIARVDDSDYHQQAYLDPVRYFLVVIRATFLKGVGVTVLWPQLLALLAIGAALMSLAILRFRKSLD
jgi:hypothetical protein